MTIYFIQEANNPEGNIKIGYTGDSVKGRLKKLQYQSPVPLQVLKTLDGDMAYEQAIHQHFADIRINGEWFEPTDELLNYIEAPFPLKPVNRHPGFRIVKSPESERLDEILGLASRLNEEGQTVILNFVRSVFESAEVE